MILGDVAGAVGKALVAGFAGVIAMALYQEIEMKLSGCKSSTGPGDRVADLLGVKPKGEKDRETFSSLTHWILCSRCRSRRTPATTCSAS